MTGIRVSNLKNITYGHIQRLLNKEDITITLIKTKKGSVQQTFPWQGTYSKIISHIEKDLKYLKLFVFAVHLKLQFIYFILNRFPRKF